MFVGSGSLQTKFGLIFSLLTLFQSRGVDHGVTREGLGSQSPQNLAERLTLFKPERADFAPHITGNPPDSKSYVQCTPLLALAIYRIVASTSPPCIEAHAGLFRSLMKGIFDPYEL